MKVEIDRELCIGSGVCVYNAERVFDQDDEDGRVIALVSLQSIALRDCEAVRNAVERCPSGALSWWDE